MTNTNRKIIATQVQKDANMTAKRNQIQICMRGMRISKKIRIRKEKKKKKKS